MKYLIMRCLIVLAILFPTLTFAQQDTRLNIFSAAYTIATDVTWGASPAKQYIFRPLYPNENITLYITNKNPTNNHIPGFQLFSTGSAQVGDYTNNSKSFCNVAGCANNNFTFSGQANVTSTLTLQIYNVQAAQIALQLTSGNTSLAGSPDTYDLFIVQTPNASNINTFTGGLQLNVPIFVKQKSAGYISDYDTGLVVVPTGAPVAPTGGGTNTLVNTLYCNNTTASAAVITITNTAGTAYVSSFSIPANSNVQFINSSLGLNFVGVKWGQVTASAINCQLAGLQ